MSPIFITGIGTNVGKTLVSAILVEALSADYWKPIQTGNESDRFTVSTLVSNKTSLFHKESYWFSEPISPHIAAENDEQTISLEKLEHDYGQIQGKNKYLIIEGAGGLMAPINNSQFMLDVIKSFQAKVILVSRNYLGSINHSLLTALACKQHGLDVIGWVFNDQYLNYEDEIVVWSGIPKIASIPFIDKLDVQSIHQLAQLFKGLLLM